MSGDIVTMHQPNYLPWIGFFSKICMAQRVIFMDMVQFTRQGLIHRNKIRCNTGSCYVTIPLGKPPLDSLIRELRMPEDNRWKKEHWESLYHHYVATPFFGDYADFFNNLYRKDFRYLTDFNLEIIRYLMECFHISTNIECVSDFELPAMQDATERIIAALKAVGAGAYLSGPTGRNYLQQEKFRENGLECMFLKFRHPEYKQRYPGFVPNLSAIDLLFNMGPRSGDIIRESGAIEASHTQGEHRHEETERAGTFD